MTLRLRIGCMAPALCSAPLVIPRFFEALSSHEPWTQSKGRAANDAGQQSESAIARVTSSVQIPKSTSVRRGMTGVSTGEVDFYVDR
ncbi:hypothetical protein FB107DRAFT_254333 [Schizophyllum commune]